MENNSSAETPGLRLNPIGALLRHAWNLYVEHFSVALSILAWPIILIGLGNIFLAIGSVLAIVGSIILAAGYILLIIGGAAIIYTLRHRTNVKESFRAGVNIFWPFFWAAILVIFAALGGFVMLVIPGIWLAVGLVFTSYSVVLEGKRGMEALAESREYVRGYWWAVFGRLVLLGIISIVFGAVINVPFVLVGGNIGRVIASAIVLLFLVPFSIAYHYTIFQNLRELKPSVHEKEKRGSRTFIVVAQVVAIIFLLLVATGIVVMAIFGSSQNRMPFGRYHNGYYGGYGDNHML